jgi:hypothetical protein
VQVSGRAAGRIQSAVKASVDRQTTSRRRNFRRQAKKAADDSMDGGVVPAKTTTLAHASQEDLDKLLETYVKQRQ